MKKLINKSLWLKFNSYISTSVSPTLVIVYILMVAFFAINNPLFVSLRNYQTIASSQPLIGIVAIGFAIVLITGNVDISVGSLAGFVATVSALLIRNTQLSIWMVVSIGILIGIAVGTLNGVVVNFIGVNSVITTLGMWAFLRGLSQAMTSGTVYYQNPEFQEIGRGYIFKFIPNVFLFMIILLVIMYLVLRFTKFGRDIYVVGADTLSARAVGVNVKRTKFLAFLLSSSFTAFAGIFLAMQIAGVHYTSGTGWEFKALTICVIGGISLSGGRGTFVGLFLAWIILGSLSNGLTLINMPNYWREFFWGGLLIFSIILDSIRTRKSGIV